MIINYVIDSENDIPSVVVLVDFPSKFIERINKDKKFLKQCAKLIEEELEKPSYKNNKGSSISIIYRLCRSCLGLKIFEKVLKVNPKIAKLIKKEDLSFVDPESQFSTLFFLCRSDLGQRVFNKLLKLNKDIYQMITQEGLCTVTKLDSEYSRIKDKNTSALFWLLVNKRWNPLFSKLLSKNPNIAQMITPEALCTLKSDDDTVDGLKNTSVLYWMLVFHQGAWTFLRLLDLNPEIASMITPEALCTIRDSEHSGEYKNTSALYWFLLRISLFSRRYQSPDFYCERHEVTKKLLELNPKIAKMITPEALYAIPGKGEKNTVEEYKNTQEVKLSPLSSIFFRFNTESCLIYRLLNLNPKIANLVVFSKYYLIESLRNKPVLRKLFATCYSLDTMDLSRMIYNRENMWTVQDILRMNLTVTKVKYDSNFYVSMSLLFLGVFKYQSAKISKKNIEEYIERNKSIPELMYKFCQYFATDKKFSINEKESRWFHHIFNKKLSSINSFEQFIIQCVSGLTYKKFSMEARQVLCYEMASYLNALGGRTVFNKPVKDITLNDVQKEIDIYTVSIFYALRIKNDVLARNTLYKLLFSNGLYDKGSDKNKDLVTILLSKKVFGLLAYSRQKMCDIFSYYKLQSLASSSTTLSKNNLNAMQDSNTGWNDLYEKYKKENANILKGVELCEKELNKNLNNNRGHFQKDEL